MKNCNQDLAYKTKLEGVIKLNQTLLKNCQAHIKMHYTKTSSKPKTSNDEIETLNKEYALTIKRTYIEDKLMKMKI